MNFIIKLFIYLIYIIFESIFIKLIQFFFKTNAIFNAGVLAVVGYFIVFVFLIKSNCFRLLYTCLQNTFLYPFSLAQISSSCSILEAKPDFRFSGLVYILFISTLFSEKALKAPHATACLSI